MRSTWVKFLIALLLPIVAVSAFANEPESDPNELDDDQYFESAYTSCLTRYQASKLTRREVDCVCDRLANYALEWRKNPQASETMPAAPETVYQDCQR